MKELAEIQKKLKAPKNQFNSFGKYKYRNCEDILEGVKPLLGDAILTLSDDIVVMFDRCYVKATATFILGDAKVETTGYARESESKKGMDSAQITGAASSYARKYALNGLFCIDDTKDSDSQDNSNPTVKNETIKPISDAQVKSLLDADNNNCIPAMLKLQRWGTVAACPVDKFDSALKYILDKQ